MKEAMKEIKETAREFAIMVYGPMIAFMFLLACLEAIGGHASGAAACAGIATIFAAMYAATIVTTAMIELVAAIKR
nr:MAG TPA: hypothetical protein [Caudoviricetes sp.]